MNIHKYFTHTLAFLITMTSLQGCGQTNGGIGAQAQDPVPVKDGVLRSLVSALNSQENRSDQVSALIREVTSLAVREHRDAGQLLVGLSSRIGYECPQNEDAICVFKLSNE